MRAALVAIVIATAIAVSACSSSSGGSTQAGSRVVRGASPEAGKTLILHYGCGACHQIPGVTNANGLVGPPLIHFGQRGIIAGFFPNTPDNLIDWIDNPQAKLPGNAMPDLGVTKDEARNIAAYLESLQ